MHALRALIVIAGVSLAACSPPAQNTSAPPEVRPISAAARSEMERVNTAASIAMPARAIGDAASSDAATPEAIAAPQALAPPQQEAQIAPAVAYDAGLVRLQVLFDRAHISPGVIDGYDGDNVRKAIAEYQVRHGLNVTGLADAALLQRLGSEDAAPALVAYAIADADVRGPFAAVPQGLQAQSQMQRLNYASPAEGLG